MTAKRFPGTNAVPADRAWLRHYDPGVPRTIAYPSHALQDFLSASAGKYPGRACTVLGNRSRTYAQVQAQTDSLARALLSLGVRKGDRVGILMPNVPDFVIAFYGIIKCGAVVVALNPLGTANEHLNQIRDSGIESVLVSSDLYATFTSRADPADRVRLIVAPRDDDPPRNGGSRESELAVRDFALQLRPNDIWLGNLLARFERDVTPLPSVEADDTVLFQYSGGTTGPSKAAVATHRGVVANTIQFRRWLADLKDGSEVVLLAIPLYHAYGMIAGMSLGVSLGATLALVPNPRDIEALLKTIAQRAPTLFPGVPGLYNALASHPEIAAGRLSLASIRVCISGSTPLMRETKERFEKLSGGRICEGYGLSEAPVVTHCNPLAGPNKIGSIGMPMPDVDCRIVRADDGGQEVEPGVAGELILRGPQLMRGYHNNPDETAVAMRQLDDGHLWLFTGDIARMDEDGYFYIVDRKKDVIKAGGFQVWPRDVEEVLAAHPSVLEAAVAGIQDPARGEIVKAWIVLRPGQAATAEELRLWCRHRLAAYKVPAEIEFRTQLPKSNVGKTLRRELVREHDQAADRNTPRVGG